MKTLTELWGLFPFTTQSDLVTLASRDGLLYVQHCMWSDDNMPHADPVKIVVIYKSPLVTGTSRMYQDTCHLLLEGGEVQDLLYEREIDDDNMLHGKGIFLVVRLCDADNDIRRVHNRAFVTEMIDKVYEKKGVA